MRTIKITLKIESDYNENFDWVISHVREELTRGNKLTFVSIEEEKKDGQKFS